MSVRAHGEGLLAVDVAETLERGRAMSWQPVHSLLSQRQEAGGVLASCHRPDARASSVCASDQECGVSSETCLHRRCSAFGYCFSPVPK